MQATITLEYDGAKTAKAIAKAVSPDNSEVPKGLKVTTEQKGAIVITDITLDGKLSTFLATIDDLLESASTAEKAILVIQKKIMHH